VLAQPVLSELDRVVAEEVASWRSIEHLLPAGSWQSALPSL
jgi:hypothetical protein